MSYLAEHNLEFSYIVVTTLKHKHVCTKLTIGHKVTYHEKFGNSTNAITTAHDAFQEEAHAIAQDHGQ
jgi:hypothetical protein